MKKISFPQGKKFAFTIFDDTDNASVENVRPIYELLSELNMRTTKSVWVFPTDNERNPYFHSQTLADPDYLSFIRWLMEKGFEVSFHGASTDSNPRAVTLAALQRYRELLGQYPNIHTNHSRNKDNLYWGHDRIDFLPVRLLMKLRRSSTSFAGHRPESPFYWGDLCQQHITYVRNFVFREINLLRINPTMPYRDPERPHVKYWFSSSEGGSAESFNTLLAADNQERLEREGGVCIVYTHFGKGFVENGRVNDETKELLHELSMRQGWFVTVSELLDYLRMRQPVHALSTWERMRMELTWLLTKIVSKRVLASL